MRLRPEDLEVLDWHIESRYQDDVAHRVGAKPMSRPEAIRKMLDPNFDTLRIKMAKAKPKKGSAKADP